MRSVTKYISSKMHEHWSTHSLVWIFDDEDNTFQFGQNLKQLTTLLCPFSGSIQCLEAKVTTPDDIYLYWLVVIAQVHNLIVKGKSKLERSIIEDVHRITNYWFSKMVESEQAQNIYLVALPCNQVSHMFICYKHTPTCTHLLQTIKMHQSWMILTPFPSQPSLLHLLQMVYLAVSSPRYLLSRKLVLVSSSYSEKSLAMHMIMSDLWMRQ